MKTKSNLSEETVLLENILKGDAESLRMVYRDYLPRITRYVEQNSGSADEAFDLFQEALMVLYKKFRKPDAELTSSVYTFLYAVCRNLWLKRLRKKKTSGVTFTLDKVSIGTEEIESAIFEKERSTLYRKKFALLGEGCQQLLKLFFLGKSMREIAEKLSISEKYARKRKFQCKEQLVKLIKSDPSFTELSIHGN